MNSFDDDAPRSTDRSDDTGPTPDDRGDDRYRDSDDVVDLDMSGEFYDEDDEEYEAPSESSGRAEGGGSAADEGVRLQKLMAAAGVASRRVSEDMIAEGRVSVNGEVVTEPGRRVDPSKDELVVDGVSIQLDPSRRYLMLNKPVGIVSSLSDEQGRPDLTEFTERYDERLFNVGRLDSETSGLLILTNDGALAHILAHPSFGVTKTYVAKVQGVVTAQTIATLTRGIELEDGPIQADKARILAGQGVQNRGGGAAAAGGARRGDQGSGDFTLVELTLHSGRNRIVRRMMAAVGHPVIELVRRQFGPLHLGTLAIGGVRDLTKDELGALLTVARQPKGARVIRHAAPRDGAEGTGPAKAPRAPGGAARSGGGAPRGSGGGRGGYGGGSGGGYGARGAGAGAGAGRRTDAPRDDRDGRGRGGRGNDRAAGGGERGADRGGYERRGYEGRPTERGGSERGGYERGGYERGGSDRGFDRRPERGDDRRSSDRGYDRGSERGADRGGERRPFERGGSDRGGSERGGARGADRGPARGGERDGYRGADRRPSGDRSSDRGGYGRDGGAGRPDRQDRGYDRGAARGDDRGDRAPRRDDRGPVRGNDRDDRAPRRDDRGDRAPRRDDRGPVRGNDRNDRAPRRDDRDDRGPRRDDRGTDPGRPRR